jgi:SsrA-binding protein
MAKKPAAPARITNRRARYDYELGDSLVAGLQLSGAETKALRLGHGQLRGAFVAPQGNELWLVNAQIMGSRGVPIAEDEVSRSRKVLAKRKEIDQMLAARKAGNTIVPLELLTKGRYIKLRIATGRGKKRYDKRETIKRRQQEREANRLIK